MQQRHAGGWKWFMCWETELWLVSLTPDNPLPTTHHLLTHMQRVYRDGLNTALGGEQMWGNDKESQHDYIQCEMTT